MCLRLHECDNGMTEHVNGHTKGRFRELSTGGAQNATKCKSRFLGTVKASKDVPFCQVAFENAVYKVLEVGQLWLPHMLNLLVCMVREVVLRSHPIECQHTAYTTYILFR